MNVKKQLMDGLIHQNPVTVQLLGMCSVLAITTSLFNGIGMGLSVLVILTCANVVISLLRKVIPSKIRIACYIVRSPCATSCAPRPGFPCFRTPRSSTARACAVPFAAWTTTSSSSIRRWTKRCA